MTIKKDISTTLLLIVMSSHGVTSHEHYEVTLGKEIFDQRAQCNDYTYYSVEVTDPCKDIRIQVKQIEGEPNVYVGKSPNTYPHFLSLTWSSYSWGSDTLVISSWDPEFTIGTYYIGVHSFCDATQVKTGDTGAVYSLLVEGVTSTHTSQEIALGGFVEGRIGVDAYDYYKFCVPSTCTNITVQLENCLNPSDCPTTYAYPEMLVSRSIVRPTINDHTWKLADITTRSVFLLYDNEEFFPGHYFVGVYGWCTPDRLCPDLESCGPCSYASNHQYKVSVLTEAVNEDCVPRKPMELCEKGNAGNGIRVRMSPLVLGIVVLWVMVSSIL